MTRQVNTLATMLVAVGTIALTAAWVPVPKLVWNASASVPIGLYAVQSTGALAVGKLVVVQPSGSLADFLADGGYLPKGLPLIKNIAALPGSRVCRGGLTIRIDGIALAKARVRDHAGRVLPIWSGCRRIVGGEVFLLNAREPASLDGRYFGPLPRSSIVGRAVPLWTRKAH